MEYNEVFYMVIDGKPVFNSTTVGGPGRVAK